MSRMHQMKQQNAPNSLLIKFTIPLPILTRASALRRQIPEYRCTQLGETKASDIKTRAPVLSEAAIYLHPFDFNLFVSIKVRDKIKVIDGSDSFPLKIGDNTSPTLHANKLVS